MKFHSILAAGLVFFLAGPSLAEEGTKAPVSGIEIKAMDRSAKPQDDFYGFVNGAWVESTEMPSDKSRYSMFNVLSDRIQEQLKDIIQEAAQSEAKSGSNAQKLGDMYNSFLDQKTVESLGHSPIKASLEGISKVNDLQAVAAKMGELEALSVKAPFGFYVYPDAKNPAYNGLWMFQSGLTMPDRDYYLNEEEKYRNFRSSFQDYATALLKAADYPEAEDAAKRILELEKNIAELHLTRVESRDAEKNYNKRSVEEVQALLEGFDWEAYAKNLGIAEVDQVIVRNYPYFEKLGQLFSSTDVQTWKDYLSFQTLDHYAPALSSEFENLHFGFHQTTLNGVPENEPRWKRAVDSTSGVLGEVLGQEYVSRHFPAEAKARMEGLVENLLKAYGESILELEWMSQETKGKALTKLSKFKPKIGYPDKWRDYSALVIKPGDLVGNLNRSARFELAYDLAKIGKPIDPVDWGMTPQTVNAYYSPTRNEIVFPAAILQPPFFNLDADDAVNYGGIGGVIGHEIGHGFDDQGSKYDGEGNLRSWWTDEDRKAFDALGSMLVEQYNQFSPLEGMNVNGRLTLGENIGDLAGVAIGYKAYLASLEGKEPPVIDGFTGPQRFFMGWAQVWRGKIREDALRARLLSDPHSPADFRVIGPLRNVDGFYQAFEVKEGDAMFLPPGQRVKIW